MFSRWFQQEKIIKLGFEDVLYGIHHNNECILMNTMPHDLQNCLIQNTLLINIEEQTINKLMDQNKFQTKIILYGKNSTDNLCDKKYKQLCELGFSEVYIYAGGMFEWLLLQDIYSNNEFPTTTKINDILLYKSSPLLHIPRLGNT
jgi:rhodanese-related sulfurtransferase|tara:strand:+ start:1448 stop:1885 length:438 start_codon:yes stop_codon:yes gene_type:complete